MKNKTLETIQTYINDNNITVRDSTHLYDLLGGEMGNDIDEIMEKESNINKNNLMGMTKNILYTADKHGVAYIYDNGGEYRIVSHEGKYVLSCHDVNMSFDLLDAMNRTGDISIIDFITNFKYKN